MSSVDRFKTFLEKDSKGHFRATDKGAGMTQKGVDAFRRANPGSKLQTAVTTKPSKLKKGSKAANRRKSFCARSAGQMKKFPAAAKDPDSRLRQARRRWNFQIMKQSLEINTELKMTTNARLDRIEEKLDNLTEAMVSLARAEEKIIGIKEDQTNMYDRMNRFSEKLDNIERQVQDNAQTVKVINKLFWVAVIAVAGSIAAQMWM